MQNIHHDTGGFTVSLC